MSDIVTRLRRAEYVMFSDGWQSSTLHETAADEIERLTKERDDYKADYLRRHKEARDRMDRALVAEARCAMLEKALEPFVRDIENWTDDDGWAPYAPSMDRIRDWFGPSDFRSARSALRPTTAEESKG